MAEPELAGAPVEWLLDPAVTYLNHGSFGSCPRAVMEVAQELRARFERQPMQFVLRELEPLLDEARAAVAAFVGADAPDLVFVPNATTGVNAVLASLELQPDDELLVTDHGYHACRNAIDHYARRARARVVVAKVPFPVGGAAEIEGAILGAVTPRTRLAMLDHITSPTALVFPVAELVQQLEARGIDTLIDGAHAPGQVPLDLRALGATYFVANFHKWCCTPKSAAMLYVRPDRAGQVRPTVIGHGAASPRSDRSRFFLEFDWTGTHDPSAVLAVPFSIRYLSSLLPGGMPALQARNHSLVLEARRLLAAALGVPLPCPDELIGAMAALPLPEARGKAAGPGGAQALYRALWQRHRIEAPVADWPASPRRVLRVSAQLYNHRAQYQALAAALTEELQREQSAQD